MGLPALRSVRTSRPEVFLSTDGDRKPDRCGGERLWQTTTLCCSSVPVAGRCQEDHGLEATPYPQVSGPRTHRLCSDASGWQRPWFRQRAALPVVEAKGRVDQGGTTACDHCSRCSLSAPGSASYAAEFPLAAAYDIVNVVLKDMRYYVVLFVPCSE